MARRSRIPATPARFARRRSRRRASPIVWLAGLCGLLGGCDGPVGPLPGGRLRGEDRPCASDWRAYDSEHEVELEIKPSAPRSVRIWNVVENGRLFVPGDFLTPFKRWPHQVTEDPRVRLRIAGTIFRCEATRVRDASQIDALRRAAALKYELEPDGWAARSEVWWFELVPRPADARVRAPETR